MFSVKLYAGESLKPFSTYKSVVSTTGKSLFETLQALLDAHGFDIENVRGFGTNGAENTLWEYRGLKSRLAEIKPLAKREQCACHVLNLLLIQACEGNVKMKVFFATLKEL